MSKKTLNESTVRRFMGLANITPIVTSSFLRENFKEEVNEDEAEVQEEGMYGEEDDPAEEGPPPEEEMPPMEPEMDAEVGPEMDAEPEGAPELEITREEATVLLGVLEKLTAAMPADEEEPMEEPPMDAEIPPEEEIPPEGGVEGEEAPPEEEMLEQALAGTDLELSEDDVVKEVARRVAARILKAKRAKLTMDRALGNKRK